MATQNEYPLPKDSYAAFDAISLRNLIIDRLNAQGTFTDQNYLGSNIANVIDIVSFAFNTLIYYLHKTSTESTFTEAQLFENINRIVKLLDYKPTGYQTSILNFNSTASELNSGYYTIPRFSYIVVNGIPFSFIQDTTFFVPSSGNNVQIEDLNNKISLFQGVFRESAIFTAAGDLNEVITIDEPNMLIDHDNIFVYVYEQAEGKWMSYKEVNSFHSQKATERVFEKRLNPDLLYEITFGDGIYGKKLAANDQVIVYYLQSSGSAGVVGPNVLGGKTPAATLFGGPNYNNVLADTNVQGTGYITATAFRKLKFDNIVGSTLPRSIEDAESIRKNAPAAFKSQYRLVTIGDYEAFIRNRFSNIIEDVKVMDNWSFMSSYMKYFQKIGIKPTAFQQIVLNQTQYADSCNFNNVYICALPRVSQTSTLKYLLPTQKEMIVSDIDSVKLLTAETSFVDPIYKAMGFGVPGSEAVTADLAGICAINIVKSPNSNRSDNSIRQEVITKFRDFFAIAGRSLGGRFEYAALVQSILETEGVSRIQTYNTVTKETFEGLSFVTWNPIYQDLDVEVVYSSFGLDDFGFYYFDNLGNIDLAISVVSEETAKSFVTVYE